MFEAPGDVDVAVAFVSKPGLDLIRPALEAKLDAGDKVRLLVDLKAGATDPSALWDLVSLNTQHLANLQLKTYVHDTGILHSKVYISKNGNYATLISGSANLSSAALEENIEHGLHLAGDTSEQVVADVLAEFERLWNSQQALRLASEAARLYEKYAGLRRISSTRSQRRSQGHGRT